MAYDNYRHWLTIRIRENSINNPNGCLEYGGGKLKHKYGLVSITIDMIRKSVPAHRALWMAVNDRLDLPSDIYILHSCDNQCCVNIDHLEAGTPGKNSQDCVERGRRAKKHRSHTRQRVHGDEKVRAIRAAVGKTAHIAQEFGVSPSYVSKLRSGKAKAALA